MSGPWAWEPRTGHGGHRRNGAAEFWANVAKCDGRDDLCWLWIGRHNHGYGSFFYNGRNYRAHRIAYEIMRGPIPEGMQTDHLCRLPLCVNPAHLEIVTPRENTLRSLNPAAKNARKTHCNQGHPLIGDNIAPSPLGWRVCRRCSLEASRRHRAKVGPEKMRARWREQRRRTAYRAAVKAQENNNG